jgi:8-oxo-dGTP pyrophosphatase MutT (NUDIX family)
MIKEDLIKLLKDYEPDDLDEQKSKDRILSFVYNSDNFISRENAVGHITGAAWIVSKDRKKVLLTHHKKLDMWLQLGGHVDSDEHILETALREAREESGLTTLKCLSDKIFDVDVHLFPKKGEVDAHYHFDIRFLFEADENEELHRQKSESKGMKWIALDEVSEYAKEDTILRMTSKI